MTLNLLQASLPLRFRPRRALTDLGLETFCKLNEAFVIERDASGWIVIKRAAGCQVSLMSIAIAEKLVRWNDANECGVCFTNSGFALPDKSMFGCPLSWMLKKRWESLSAQEQRSFAPRCPDFVVEFVSQFDSTANMKAKMDVWMTNGVQLAWLITPKRKTVAVYRQGEPIEILRHPLSLRGSGPLAGFEMLTTRLWNDVGDVTHGRRDQA